jgi:hypothetical protein
MGRSLYSGYRNYGEKKIIYNPHSSSSCSSISTSTSADPTNLNTLFNSNVYSKVIQYNNQFVRGNLTYLLEHLTIENYNNLVIELLRLKIPNDTNYELTRNLVKNILRNLYQAVIQYHLLLNTKKNLDASTKIANVLNSVSSIMEYLEKLKRSNYLFSTSVTTVAAKVKPEYAIYISKYGIPEGGVFDSDLLAEIIKNL